MITFVKFAILTEKIPLETCDDDCDAAVLP